MKVIYFILFSIVDSPILLGLASLDEAAGGNLGGQVTWLDRLTARREYYKRKMKGINTTYDEVFYEVIIVPFNKKLEQALENRDMILVEENGKQWLHTEEEYIKIMASPRRYGNSQKAYKVGFNMQDKYKRTADIGYPFTHEKAGETRTLKEWVEKCKEYKLDEGRSDELIAASIVKKANTTIGWEKVK